MTQHAHHHGNQRTITTPENYYSGIAFVPSFSTHDAGLPFTATIARGKAVAFSYIVGEDMNRIARSGASGTHTATDSDTNLAGAGGSTMAGDELHIFGLSLQLSPQCKAPELAAKVWSNAYASFIYAGKKIGFQIGPLFFIPGQSSLYGVGQNRGAPVPAGSNGGDASYSFMSNGAPGIDNFMRIPEGLIWTSAGRPDSNMTLVVELTRDVSVSVPATIASGTGVAGWPQPTDPEELAVEMTFKLHARIQSGRSQNR